MFHIPASELRTHGITALKQRFAEDEGEGVITVRGESKYVVMPIATYQHFREVETLLAYEEVQKDIKAGRYHEGDVASHMKAVTEGLETKTK